ncbi:MAG TPA: DinB family protein [Bryobacteraceae bacterium]|nr:DinB family protein [Bryobacteraceae bacterium]
MLKLVVCCLCAVVAAAGQGANPTSSNPLSDEVRESYRIFKTNFLKMADRMPAEKYGFKPVPEVETFGQRLAHIIVANTRACAGLKGESKSVGPRSTAKADLVVALRDSFAYCDTVFESITDAAAVQMVAGTIGNPPLPAGTVRSRLSVLYSIVRHSNEMYGYMAVYLRLNGIVPPSSSPD